MPIQKLSHAAYPPSQDYQRLQGGKKSKIYTLMTIILDFFSCKNFNN
jgi:hypothetical protein